MRVCNILKAHSPMIVIYKIDECTKESIQCKGEES